jgi:hypothetical protein
MLRLRKWLSCFDNQGGECLLRGTHCCHTKQFMSCLQRVKAIRLCSWILKVRGSIQSWAEQQTPNFYSGL